MNNTAFSNKVFIGTSLDGYIADRDGGLEWLDIVPNPAGLDLGYYKFMDGIDALVMGRKSYETVLRFGIDWPYKKKVFVLTNSLSEVPEELEGRVEFVSGSLAEVLEGIQRKGFHHLYIDGGKTVQSFLQEDLIDELIITQIPVLLGGGIPLFGELSAMLEFELLDTKVQLGQLVQRHYRRRRA